MSGCACTGKKGSSVYVYTYVGINVCVSEICMYIYRYIMGALLKKCPVVFLAEISKLCIGNPWFETELAHLLPDYM